MVWSAGLQSERVRVCVCAHVCVHVCVCVCEVGVEEGLMATPALKPGTAKEQEEKAARETHGTRLPGLCSYVGKSHQQPKPQGPPCCSKRSLCPTGSLRSSWKTCYGNSQCI